MIFVDVNDITKGGRKRMKLTTINIEQGDYDYLDRYCRTHDVTKSHVIRKLIKQFREQTSLN